MVLIVFYDASWYLMTHARKYDVMVVGVASHFFPL